MRKLFEEQYSPTWPAQRVELVVPAPQPPVTEVVLHLTPPAAKALYRFITEGKWPQGLDGGLLNSITFNLGPALREVGL